MTDQAKGFINGIVSGISFGMIPLFSIPVIAAGMGNVSILVYRFLMGSMVMLAMLLVGRTSLRIGWSDVWRIAVLSFFYNGTALTTLECYHYLSSGVATALVYTDPIWCALIGLAFLGDRFSWKLSASIFMATIGVMMLTGVFAEDGSFNAVGVFWGLLSGLSYALYLIVLPRMRLSEMPSLKLTFYVFFIAMLQLALFASLTGGVEAVATPRCWLNLFLLGLIPTAVSNICVTRSLKLIDSTVVAILGAFEPLTAMIIGVCFLGDPFTALIATGSVLILAAVYNLTVPARALFHSLPFHFFTLAVILLALADWWFV